MTDLTPEQIAARQANGEFGTHDHTAPDFELDGNAYRDVTSPLTVVVRQEVYQGDYVHEVGRVEFDARAIFDARKLADINPETTYSDQDWVFHEAQNAGLVPEYDGPFTVDLPDDFDEYIEHRENNGMVEPYEGAAESLALQVREAKLSQRQEALEKASRLLGEAGDGATETKQAEDFTPGDVLVNGTSRLTVQNVERSSSMPGFLAVETEFGTLYLDPKQEFEVEAD